MGLKKSCALTVGVIAALAGNHAWADDWYEANTAHFQVYAEGSAGQASELAVKLERLDEAMRYMQNVQPDEKIIPASRLTVFQFGESDDIAALIGSRSSGVAGFFIPRAGSSVAFVPADNGRREAIGSYYRGKLEIPTQIVLFHEYAHYFMYQHAAASYPYWYSEGFAEVYGTVEFLSDGFVLGAPPRHRDDEMRALARKSVRLILDPPEKIRSIDVSAAYAMGWLLSHYLTFSGERVGQLPAYFDLMNQGKSSIEAAEEAFGDLDKLDKELDRYLSGRARGLTVTFDGYQPPKVSERKVSEAESDRMRLMIRTNAGLDHDDAKGLVDDAYSLAEKHPGSVPALTTAMNVLFDAGKYEEAGALGLKIAQIDPEAIRANLGLARLALTHAGTDPGQYTAARQHIAKVNRLQPNQPEALYLFYLSYFLSGEHIPEIALIALEQANAVAPFDRDIRTSLAHLLLLENRDKAALTVLSPLTNDAERTKQANELRELIDHMETDRGALLARLKPQLTWLSKEEEGD